MFGFMGYNFCYDENALDSTPNLNNTLVDVMLENGIYDHVNVTNNTEDYGVVSIPSWDYETILDCNFNNNTSGGNIDISVSTITAVRVKRREVGTFDWYTLYDVPIENYGQLRFVIEDRFCPSGKEFEYAVVPVLVNTEGNYITNTIETSFNGVYLFDEKSMFKFYSNVSYGTNTSVQPIGMLQAINSKYPIVITNGESDYNQGVFNGDILGTQFEDTRVIDKQAILKQHEALERFLKNKKPKFIKDWNGNIWLIMVISNPTVTYNNSFGMSVLNVSFGWAEQGKYNNQEDMFENGFTNVL